MKILLLHLDGKLPNLALMRVAAHHRAAGDVVTYRRAEHASRVAPQFGDSFDRVYASAIFQKSLPLVAAVKQQWPGAIVGGTGVSVGRTLADVGIDTLATDYSDHPADFSMGFVFRGCRLGCSHCVVPEKEGRVRPEQTVGEIWRGDPHPRHLILLDNDFGGHPTWRDRAREIIDGRFKVSFFQGLNARLLSEELAEALAAMDLRDAKFKEKRIYTAWDNRRDEKTLFRGLGWLVNAGIRPDNITVYVLCGYCHFHQGPASRCPSTCSHADHHEDRDYRRRRLREFGADPYPMPYERTPELVAFQRYVVQQWDKRVSWRDWTRARYQPANLRPEPTFPLLEVLS
jgi:hypothetical protein